MGLPVSKEELAANPEASSSSQIPAAITSTPKTLTSISRSIAPAFAALGLATLLDIFAPVSPGSWFRAGAAYFAVIVCLATLIRSSVKSHGLLTEPLRDPFVAVVTVAALCATATGTILTIYRAPISDFAALHLLEFGAVIAGFSLWFELREFIVSSLDVLVNPAAGLFPEAAWTQASTDAPEVKTAPETLRPGDLCLCRNGETVPADGTVERGVAVLWERTVCGRARLRIRGVGEEIFAGSTIVTGELLARVSAELRDSRITSFIDLVKRAGQSENPFMRALKGPGLLSILFVAACVVLGWHELQLSWEAAILAGSSALACVVLVDICLVTRALPAIFIKRAFQSGVLFQSKDALIAVAGLDELVIDHSTREPAIAMQVRDFVIMDERLDRPRIESALLAIFSRSGEDLAGAFEQAMRTPSEQMFPCKLADYREYPGLGYSGNIEGAELSVGSEDFLVARGVRMQPSEILSVQSGQQNIYVALDDEVVARFVFAEPKIEPLSLKLANRKVQLRLYSTEDQKSVDEFGKRAGIELALIKGGLSIDEYREKIRALKAPGLLASGATDPGLLREARVSIAAFNPVRWNFERTPITVFGEDSEVTAAVFETAGRHDTVSKGIAAFSVVLTVLLLGLSVLARLTPAAVLVAALSGLTFVLLAADERSEK